MTTHGKMKTIRVTSINVLEGSALGEKQTKDGEVAGIRGDEERRALQRALKEGGRMGRMVSVRGLTSGVEKLKVGRIGRYEKGRKILP